MFSTGRTRQEQQQMKEEEKKNGYSCLHKNHTYFVILLISESSAPIIPIKLQRKPALNPIQRTTIMQYFWKTILNRFVPDVH